ncbi:uncharacterized protein K02A2.6-like isoform X2 [Oryzias latipes]|uniref:uncharacterized protein K02A2.6-like isoform X2 n=1 Tax=Oryzias latipes TaxID=8090 RepID=UPI000CE183AE|nr:uncharacterized protein K02A2.6-like isoform X2 [Oryzias latipes]
MEGLKPPAQWSMDAANLPKAWKTWKEEFTLYTELALPDTEEKARVKLFYYLIGERGRELCGTLIGAESRVTVSGLMVKIDEHCNPKVNETVERYRFFARNQALGENIDKYVTDLRMLASTCNFGQLRDSLIRDRIVCGTSSSSWRERLLREENLTLDKCLDICRAMEISREYNKTITGQTLEELHVIRQKEKKSQERGISCRYCGRLHERIKSKCPAYGKNCKKCGRENHFAITCRSKTVRKENTPREKRKTVHTVTEQDSDSGEDILTVTAITQTAEEVNQFDEGVGKKKEQLFAGMMIDNSLVQFQIDCGATCNVIPINLLNPNVKMEHTDKVLVMYNKSKLCPLGKCKVKMVNPKNNKKYKVEFQVVGEDCKTPLLGGSASEAMKLIQVKYDNIYALDSSVTKAPAEENTWLLEEIKTEFQDVFTGDGCLKGEYELEIDPTVQPVKLPKRRVPVSMMKPLKEELKSLEDRRIITPVEHSTEWISGMVTVQKPNGRPRICIDPRPLNKALKRSHFPLPTIDDILPDVSKAKVFTVCDVKHGFWHVKLTEESSQLTTFATPFGRFRWLRMPMGISPAPEVFQRRLMQALENLPGTYVIADDILITGKGDTTEEAEKDHDRNLRLFLERCREKNIKLNVEKLKLRRREVPYIGHLLTADGLRADPEKDELSTQDGLVFKGERVVIPDALQAEITQRIHSTHIGTEGCLRRARDCIYWHGMNGHIKKYIAKCDICRKVDAKQQKETLRPHELTDRPWTKVGTDLFNFDGREYLITVDYYSNFWEIDHLPDTKSSTVIRKLKAHFARQGIPEVVFSDNGPQYSSTEFASFSQKWDFKHKTSSPGYPQSNGKAESAVKTAKRLMRKAKLAGQDPYLALLDHRNTPTQGLDTSPAQRLLSRRTRTLIPMSDSLLQPKVTKNNQGLTKNRERQSKYYNRTARDMDNLNPGDSVRVQPFEPHGLWDKARVCKTLGDRSYEVEMDNGRVLRRNRRHLRRAVEVDLKIPSTPKPVRLNSGPRQGDLQNTTTKSGRVVHQPRYLKDYVCS